MKPVQTLFKAAIALGAVTLSVGVVSAATIFEQVTVTTQINPGQGISEFVYTITNNSGRAAVDSFEIPEFHLGDLFASIGTSPTAQAPFNFSFSESTTSSLFAPGGGLYSGTPGAYLFFSGGSIAPGDSVTFSLFTTQVGSTNAKFAFSLPSVEQIFLVDPLIPGTAGVPEPASWALMLAGFGLAGAAMRRRTRVAVTYV
jgi:PEP-CTERM motif